ncbi:MAG: hypothetical protein DRR19_09095 [Candidatus Parabeggiatoa sp. nov. 1]|nr:MAG: hypothetical protein DRR19_09095 [Gammaproteobacteria bacterium]
MPNKKLNKKNQKKIEALYNEYRPLFLGFLKNKLHIPKQDAEDLLQETFAKVTSSIDDFRGDGSEKNWVFKIAKNTAFNYLKARKTLPIPSTLKGDEEQDEENDPLENFQASFEEFERMEKTLCIQRGMVKAWLQYERDYPHVLCPLLVILSDENCPIEEIANIIHRTVPETKKLLAQCRKKMKRYKDLDEYENRHGQESLCGLIIQLAYLGWTAKEIGEIIGKSEGAVLTAASRCRQKMKPYFKRCKDDC